MAISTNYGERIEDNIFPHSRDYLEGVKERGVRTGQATIIVALDGSGDAETIEEGINMLPSGGGVVYIKEGTYIQTKQITFPNDNISLIGSGSSTIITSNATETMFFIGKKGITFSYIKFYNTKEDKYSINFGTGAAECYINACWIESASASNGILTNGSATKIIIMNNIITIQEHIGLAITGDNNMLITNNHILMSVAGTGMEIHGGSTIISNNYFYSSSGTWGIVFNTTSRNIVSGNTFVNCSIVVNGASCINNLILGNVVLNGISDSGTGTVIEHNITT